MLIFRDASGTSGCQVVSVWASMGVVHGWVLLFSWHFCTRKGESRGLHVAGTNGKGSVCAMMFAVCNSLAFDRFDQINGAQRIPQTWTAM